MKPGRKAPRRPLGNRARDLHRLPTRFERFRAWIEGLPIAQLFVEPILLRQRLLKVGLFTAVVTAVVTFVVGLIGGGLTASPTMGALGLGCGLLSLVLAMALLPLLEDAFNILTPTKLLKLSNTSNTQIHKLLHKAPGTFIHSMQVGMLAENAAERIGASALLAHVGAYYHDIGKMEHPAYFIDNQIVQINPHDALSPALSAKVIRRHVRNGMEMGRA